MVMCDVAVLVETEAPEVPEGLNDGSMGGAGAGAAASTLSGEDEAFRSRRGRGIPRHYAV